MLEDFIRLGEGQKNTPPQTVIIVVKYIVFLQIIALGHITKKSKMQGKISYKLTLHCILLFIIRNCLFIVSTDLYNLSAICDLFNPCSLKV